MSVDLSDEDIFAAADAVLASGRNATPARVRAHLGRGSPQRIGALLDQWWSQLLGRLRSDALPATLHQALGLLWEQATAQGRKNAEAAFARQRQAWGDDRRAMEKAFARQRQALEQGLAKERQTFAEQRRRLLQRNERMREQLRQARDAAKGAKNAAGVMAKTLDKTQRHLAFIQALDVRHRQHAHEQAVELHALHLELRSGLLPGVEPPGVSVSAPDAAGGNLWRDFIPLLESAQQRLLPRIEALGRQLNAEPGQARKLDHTQRDRCLGQALVLMQLLEELRRQATAYSGAVDELFLEFMPLYLEARW